MAAAASPALNGSPHGRSTFTTTARWRRPISAIRSAKKPAENTSSFSPGSTKLETAVSMPLDPVPEMASVSVLAVAVGTLQQSANIVGNLEEVRVQIAHQRLGHRFIDAGLDLCGAGAE